MRNMKGITLVSLVVTIIVLIILAGVSINLTLGENGIITMARKARENMELAKADEERQLNELYMQIEQEGTSGEISYDAIAKLIEFKRQIASAITDMGIKTLETENAATMASNIRSLTGASSADKVSYDNTNSGLVATNLQVAVDELDNEIDELNDSLGGDETGMTLHDKLDYIISNGVGSGGSSNISQMTTLTQGYTDSLSKVTLCSYTFTSKPNLLAILNWHTGANTGYISYKINNGDEVSLTGQSGDYVKALFLNLDINVNDTITLYAYVNNNYGNFIVQLVDFK